MVGRLYDTDGTTILEENHFNSWNSKLWSRVRSTFSVDLNNMYTTLRSNGLFTLENMLSYFERVWEVIPPKMYNESQQIKYINDGATGMVALHGNRKLQIKKWLRERIAYLDSKFGYYAGGGTNEQYVNFRMNYQGAVSLDISTYYTVYAKVRWASKNEQIIRIAKGQKKTFSYYSDVGTDREVMIMLPESLKTIENISNIHPNSIDISKATKLTQIEAHNPNLFSVDLSKNKYLRKVDFNGCEKLGTETATMSLNYCKYLNYVDLRGTKLTAVTFGTKGGSLRKIYYPSTIQSLNLVNQGLLTDMILPYGADGSKAPVDLATINVENCPLIERLIDLENDPTSLSGMKYCRNLTLNNSIKLKKFNFYGFTRLANVNLQNMESLEEVDFLNMTEVGQTSDLRYIGVSACPNMTTISMNVDNPNYEITWANDSILDLQTSGGVRNIYSNCVIKGLNTILLPVTIENMYFTNEYGSGYSDIINIWSPSSATVSKTGVYPIAYHLNNNNETDDYTGIDFKDLHLYNIDLGALVKIPNAINFSLYPTNTNPNFNKNRDGSTLPYLQPEGILDLSNYTESLARFFNGVDLDKLQIIVNNLLSQKDLSYCFYNSTFSDRSRVSPILDNLVEVSNLDYCFYRTSIDSIDILNSVNLASTSCSLRYTFGGCPNIVELVDVVIPNSVSTAEGIFSDNTNLRTITNITINSPIATKLLKGCSQLASITGVITSPVLESLLEDCYKLSDISQFTIDSIPTNLKAFVKGTKLLKTLNLENVDLAQNIYFDEMCMNSGVTMLKMRGQLGVRKSTWANFISGTNNLYVDLSNSSFISNNFNNKNNFNGGNNFTVDFSNANLSQYLSFKGYFANGGIKKLIIDGAKFNVSGVSFENMCMNCTKLIEDVIFPANYVTNVTNCYNGCTNLKTVHSNWKQTYGKSGFAYDNCYTGCTGIYTIDDVVVVNEYSTGLDEIPVKWGGYGMDSSVCGIYELTFTETDANDEPTTVVYETKWQSYNYNAPSKRVNWGDGTITEDGSTTHTYVSPGVYIVKGNILLGTNQTLTDSTKNHLTKVIQHPSSVQPYYNGCKKLNYAKLRRNFTNTRQIFEGCGLLETLDISESNFENCSDYTGFLNGCKQLRKDGIIGFDNLQFRGRMESTFKDCINFGDWSFVLEKDFSEVTSLYGTFQSSSFDIEDISSASFDNVTNYTLAFAGTPITQHHVKFSNKVRMLERTYINCKNLTKVTMTADSDLSNVYRRVGMFSGCTNLIEEFDFSTINPNISEGAGNNTELSTGFPNTDVYSNCGNLVTIEKFKCLNYLCNYAGAYGNMGASPVGGCTNLKVLKEFDVTFTKSFPTARDIFINNDYWISQGWRWFIGLNNLQEIGFKGEVYSADDFRDYRILRGCKTQNFTADTWQSFVDIFPDNSSTGITKRVCVGTNIAHIPETYANLLTSKGYTLYAANS